MKILLINPPFKYTIQSCQPKILEEGIEYLPPLGLMYIAGYLLKNTKHKIEILDCHVENINYENLSDEIKKRQPDAIGITTMTFTLIDVLKTSETAKKTDPKIKVILGGPHINIYPEETMARKDIDFLVLGEGEETMKDLLYAIENKKSLHGIPGIVFKENNKIINTGTRPLIQNLDAIPFPAREITPYKNYFSALSKRFPVTTMFTSRGCPYKCLFCDRPHLGKIFRCNSAEHVVREMELCGKLGIKEIMIYDDTFTIERERVINICRQIINKNISIDWDVRARVNTVDKELLKLMATAGCKRIHFGVEAGTQKILNVLRKGITLEMAENAFRETKKAGMQTLGYFMIGSPEETLSDIKSTINFIKKISPDYIHVSVTTPFPATELYKKALDEKVIKTDVWREFAINPTKEFAPPVWDKELKREDLFEILIKIYKNFYFRPKFIIKKCLQVKSFNEFKNKAAAAFKLLKT